MKKRNYSFILMETVGKFISSCHSNCDFSEPDDQQTMVFARMADSVENEIADDILAA